MSLHRVTPHLNTRRENKEKEKKIRGVACEGGCRVVTGGSLSPTALLGQQMGAWPFA